jgi:hypothetical protein
VPTVTETFFRIEQVTNDEDGSERFKIVFTEGADQPEPALARPKTGPLTEAMIREYCIGAFPTYDLDELFRAARANHAAKL